MRMLFTDLKSFDFSAQPDSQASYCDIFMCRKKFSIFERRHVSIAISHLSASIVIPRGHRIFVSTICPWF